TNGDLIESNRQRVKTNEQIGRECAVVLEIERERARQRQEEQAKENLMRGKQKPPKPESNPGSGKKNKGDARDKAGEMTGVSGKTAERSAFCVTVMDALDRLRQNTHPRFAPRKVSYELAAWQAEN